MASSVMSTRAVDASGAFLITTFVLFLMNILPSLIRSLSSLRPAISVQLTLVFLLWRSYQSVIMFVLSSARVLRSSFITLWVAVLSCQGMDHDDACIAVYRSFVVAKLSSCTPLLVHCGVRNICWLTRIDLRAFSDAVAVTRPCRHTTRGTSRRSRPTFQFSSQQILQVTHSSSSDSRQSTSVL